MVESKQRVEGFITTGLQGGSAARKAAPIASGVLFYFPNALAAVANLSKVGNEKHNPGQPMHWAFDKSTDEADCITRHLAESGTIDRDDGVRHSVKVAWRALALAERELLAAHPEMLPGRNVRNFSRAPAAPADDTTPAPAPEADAAEWVPEIGDTVRIVKLPEGLKPEDEPDTDYSYLLGKIGEIDHVYPSGSIGIDLGGEDDWIYEASDLELVTRAQG
jgi:hypothetical protein